MKIVIVGANGFVGKALTQYLSNNNQVFPLTHQDLDITNDRAVEKIIFTARPDLIINCAVLGVEACQLDPKLAWAINVKGAENLAKAVAHIKAEILQISTNYVFDGKKELGSSYTIKDSPTPINIYGETKFAGEQAVSSINPKSFIVRTSWIFGGGKENFFCSAPLLLKQRKKIRAITDLWANSTYLDDLVLRISEILSHQFYGVYHVVNSGLCSNYQFALETARILKIAEPDLLELIEPTKQNELENKAVRPVNTPLYCINSEKLGLAPMRDWRVALTDYIRNNCL